MQAHFSDESRRDDPVNDLGPLAWVFEELRKSLDSANKAIRRFIRESEQARHSDLESVDPGSLRVARQQLHQGVGALEMVGQAAPAQVLRAMEAAVQQFVQKPLSCTEPSAGKVEQASFALIEYLEALLNNKPVSPVALFFQYREVQELAKAERVHPADLWFVEHKGVELAAPEVAKPAKPDALFRSLFDRVVLLLIKSESPAAAGQLARMSAALSAGAESSARVATFWRVSAGYFEAVAQKLVPLDVYAKRAASRILLQFAGLMQAKSANDVSETLLHDLLFFCAQAKPQSPETTPNLSAVRTGFAFTDLGPVDYSRATLGQFDPALLVQARKRIAAGKEVWSLLAGGDASRARAVLDQYGLIADSLLKLHPASTGLSRVLVKSADFASRNASALPPELSMEMATTTLYLEAAFEDFDPNDPSFTERTRALADRLRDVIAGQPAQPLESWMEQLYRRVSDRQTMGSVVGELKVSLGEAEKSLDQFFRAPREKAGLHVAVSQLVQMRGVLSVLGLDQAVQTVSRMRTSVEQILDTEVDVNQAREAGTFQQLGNNLSALSFLVDMLSYQPAVAKKLFVFDEASGELKPLMGRLVEPTTQVTHAEAHAVSEGVHKVVESAQGEVSLAELSEQLETLADQASLAEQQGVAKAARDAADAVVNSDGVAGAQAIVGLAQTQAAEVPSTDRMPSQESADDEDDLRDIFLDEGREVVGNGLQALTSLDREPGDLEQLTVLRRAFHTLKGSSRMVGLNEFGEAAWSMEQVFNSVLAEQRPAEPAVLQLAREAMSAFGRWVEDIASSQDAHWTAQPFRDSAQAWRDQQVYLPLFGAAPKLDTQTVELPPAPDNEAATVTIDLEVGPSSFAEFDLTQPQELQTSSGDLYGASGRSSAHAPLLADIDLSGLESSDSLTTSANRTDGKVDVPLDASSMFDDIELDLDAVLPQANELKDSMPGPLFHPERPETVQVSLSESEPEPLPLSEAPASAAPDIAVPDVDVTEAVVVDLEDEHHDVDEQTREIGPLRIGIRLYNVYLNEADEWSRRLSNCLAEWSLERHEPLPEQAEAWAHSLAGSSATVGFQPLSDISRALENALALVASHQRAGRAPTAEQASLFVQTSEEIRRLLHQFAAGFFKEPSPELLSRLHDELHQPLMDSVTVDDGESQPATVSEGADLDLEITSQWATAPLGDSDTVETIPPVSEALPGSDDSELETELSPLEEVKRGPSQAQDIDDDIDELDTIDADLFPIFSEEAQELLPQLGGALRQWLARPDNLSARSEVLRNLHTLKGSARLAGALRLGEMAHRMETAVERMDLDGASTHQLSSLQGMYDGLSARFELLRHSDPDLTGVLRSAPEQQVSAAVPLASASMETRSNEVRGAGAAEPAPAQSASLPPLVGTLASMPTPATAQQQRAAAAVRVRPELLDRMMNQAGEVMITRSRMESQLVNLRGSLKDLTGNLDRLRSQLRDIELQAETQMQSRLALARDAELTFDPLEFDRFTRVQELTRMMAESVSDVATVQRNLQRAVESTEDGLVAQARQTRELQRDLLRTRMVEFEGISERLYRVVRQASKETGKQVRLDITGGQIEMDRGVLDRMTAAFEHLLRNSVVHGIESPEQRLEAGKAAEGHIDVRLSQELNDVSVTFQDDGAGIHLVKLRERAKTQGLIASDAVLNDDEAAQLIFVPGLSTANEVSSLAGRGIGMDVVRNDVVALGGRIETRTRLGQGTDFKLVLPLTTAVTQVVMLRAGDLTIGVPSTQVEVVRRVDAAELSRAYESGTMSVAGEDVPFYWAGALLQASPRSLEPRGRTLPVMIMRSAAQRVALHVDEVLGNQEVVVKNLGPQLSRLPGLAGMSVLASGAVALIYNPVALSTVYGTQVKPWVEAQIQKVTQASADTPTDAPLIVPVHAVPLILVVDDSITVRRVTQRLLQREGYRVALAADGLQALERLQQEKPTVVLSDIEMPRMDGFDLVRNIRGDVRLKDLPVIMITSRIAEKHREHARELGVNHYLGKPYSEDELLALVANYTQVASTA